jgi:hypothetical protein
MFMKSVLFKLRDDEDEVEPVVVEVDPEPTGLVVMPEISDSAKAKDQISDVVKWAARLLRL